MAIQFPKPGAVPIVGQPLAVHAWAMTVLVECKCGPNGHGPTLALGVQEDHMGRRTGGVVCYSCGHLLHLKNMTMNQFGVLVFDVDRADTPVSVTQPQGQKSPPAS